MDPPTLGSIYIYSAKVKTPIKKTLTQPDSSTCPPTLGLFNSTVLAMFIWNGDIIRDYGVTPTSGGLEITVY